nr:creatininase family protein [Candidatus Sigynarchaeum springense]
MSPADLLCQHADIEPMLIDYIFSRPGQVDAAIKECPLALVPVGSLEWHGPHMPLGFDGVKAEYILRKVGTTLGKGVIFPTIFFGAYNVMNFPYTYRFPKRFLQTQFTQFTEQLHASGFTIIVYFVGHYPREQVRFFEKLAMKYMKKHGDLAILSGPEYYFLFKSRQPGDHAAKLETSLGLSLFPQHVDLNQIAGETHTREELRKLGISGEDPKATATKEKGDAWAKEIVDVIVEGIERCWKEHSQAGFLDIYKAYHEAMDPPRKK